MDPNATLKEIESEFCKAAELKTDEELWYDSCYNLNQWLASKGFEPNWGLSPIGWCVYQHWYYQEYGCWPE